MSAIRSEPLESSEEESSRKLYFEKGSFFLIEEKKDFNTGTQLDHIKMRGQVHPVAGDLIPIFVNHNNVYDTKTSEAEEVAGEIRQALAPQGLDVRPVHDNSDQVFEFEVVVKI